MQASDQRISILVIEDLPFNFKLMKTKIDKAVEKFNVDNQTHFTSSVTQARSKAEAEQHLALHTANIPTFDIVLFDNHLGQDAPEAGAELFVALQKKITTIPDYNPTCIGISGDPDKLEQDILRLTRTRDNLSPSISSTTSNDSTHSLHHNYAKEKLDMHHVLKQHHTKRSSPGSTRKQLTEQLVNNIHGRDLGALSKTDPSETSRTDTIDTIDPVPFTENTVPTAIQPLVPEAGSKKSFCCSNPLTRCYAYFFKPHTTAPVADNKMQNATPGFFPT